VIEKEGRSGKKMRVFARGGEKRDRPLCPCGDGFELLLRGMVTPWDRDVSPGFRALRWA
jgi:hypothetical protein